MDNSTMIYMVISMIMSKITDPERPWTSSKKLMVFLSLPTKKNMILLLYTIVILAFKTHDIKNEKYQMVSSDQVQNKLKKNDHVNDC